ncbi:MAG: tRNA uridine-5-carboxymethylaminomethyl(34) synthesis GTPase MnmE [Oscillospiraceae bacterium]|nr:tRNA uridine-5-carboxymethylaminomethyl(34) synthesis GTPase MnmE [Oscillospiraceae bacterium]
MSTIAAISTPPAVGGISMIRISGEKSIAVAEHLFYATNQVKVSEMRGYTCAYGYICDGNERIDDVILTVFRAPHSYTGEDTVEITCHGGLYLTNEILHLVLKNGAVPAGAGEFTKRAFLNGKLSLSQAEAVMNVIEADGKAALHQANLVKEGRLSRQMNAIADELIGILSALAYWLDDAEQFPEELDSSRLFTQIRDIYNKLSDMSKHYRDGKIYLQGIRTVLLGKPNAGKSSVMNWLCGVNRSIVTSIAGTTRDVITEQVKVGAYTLLVSDTAGIRETENEIETIGIEQAMKALSTADLVLYVIDASVGITKEDREVLKQCEDTKTVILWNKTDLNSTEPDVDFPHLLPCSMIADPPFDGLLKHLQQLFPEIVPNQPSVVNERQNQLLESAMKHVQSAMDLLESYGEPDLISVDLEIAARHLSEIDGKDVSKETIDGVFSRFCVGK